MAQPLAKVPLARPITLSPSMMGAGLEGVKTQTRRLALSEAGRVNALLAALRPGDLLYVREALDWPHFPHAAEPAYFTRAQPMTSAHDALHGRSRTVCSRIARLARERDPDWRPRGAGTKPREMPKWCTRVTLRLTAVRREALSAMTESDARAEGVITRGDEVPALPAVGRDDGFPAPSGAASATGTPASEPGARPQRSEDRPSGAREDLENRIWGHWGAWKRYGDSWSIRQDDMALSPREAFARLWDGLHPAPGRANPRARPGVSWADDPEVFALSFEWINAPFWEVLGVSPERACWPVRNTERVA